MSTAHLTPNVLEEFRGLFTLGGTKRKVPPGFSPDTLNTTFKAGAKVSSRPGFTSLATTLGNILSISEYVDNAANRYTVEYTGTAASSSLLRYEAGNFTYSAPTNGGYPVTTMVEPSLASTSQMSAVTLFGRHYFAIARGLRHIPCIAPGQIYGTTTYPYAPPGPGAAPTAADSATAGNVTAGTHKFRVFFKTATGYWTAPGPSVTLTAAGSKKVDIASIPVGPTWVVARVIAATPYCSDDYYFIEGSAMVVNDNTTTTATIDFTDTALIAGTIVSSSVDPTADMLANICIPDQTSVFAYKNRLCWVGGRKTSVRNGDVGFLNMAFNGGFNGNVPLGWTEKVSGETSSTPNGGIGTNLKITGSAVGTQKGCLENNATAAEVIPPGKQINAKVRLMKSTSSSAKVYVYFADSGDAGGTFTAFTSRLAIDLSTMSAAEYYVVEGQCLSAAQNKLTSTSRLRISAGSGGSVAANDGLGNNEIVNIDSIELYDAADPYAKSLLYWSDAGDPETVSGLTGLMQVNKDDAQDAITGFSLKGRAYILKERGLYSTIDTGDEPAFWPVDEVSNTVGTPSVRGFALGDEWAAIAARAGFYIFNGASLDCVSTPIRDTWNRINWLYGHLVWVTVNAESNYIRIGVPLDSATAVSHILSYEYTDNPVTSGNWSLWVLTGITPNCSAISERSDGTRKFLIGAADGTVSYNDSTAHIDYGSTAIDSYYVTPLFRQDERQDERGYRSICEYVNLYAEGSGSLLITGLAPDFSTSTNIGSGSLTLSSNPKAQLEKNCQVTGDAVAVKVETNNGAGSGDWFTLERLTAWITRRPGAGVTGAAG